MNVMETRGAWLVAGIVLVLAGAGAVTFGLLDGGAAPAPEVGVQRAETGLGFLLGGLVVGVAGLVLVYRASS